MVNILHEWYIMHNMTYMGHNKFAYNYVRIMYGDYKWMDFYVSNLNNDYEKLCHIIKKYRLSTEQKYIAKLYSFDTLFPAIKSNLDSTQKDVILKIVGILLSRLSEVKNNLNDSIEKITTIY